MQPPRPRTRQPLTAEQKTAAAARRAERRTFGGTDDVGLLLALASLEHRERTGDELADAAGRPAAAVAADLRRLGLELPERLDNGHDGRRRTVFALTLPDARAVAAWTRRRDRDTRRPARALSRCSSGTTPRLGPLQASRAAPKPPSRANRLLLARSLQPTTPTSSPPERQAHHGLCKLPPATVSAWSTKVSLRFSVWVARYVQGFQGGKGVVFGKFPGRSGPTG